MHFVLVLLALFLSLQPPAEDLFTEYVTWEEVNTTSDESAPPWVLNQDLSLPVNVDNNRQMIILENGDEFPFEAPLKTILLENIRQTNGKIEMVAFVEGEPEASAWVLDTATGEYTRRVTPCENAKAPLSAEYETFVEVRYSSLFDGWVFARSSEANSPELCHTGTGEHVPLPDESVVSNWQRLFQRPDEQMLILTGADAQDGSIKLVFSYDRVSGEIFELGSWSSSQTVNLLNWFGDERVVFSASQYVDSGQDVWFEVANLHETDSLRRVTEIPDDLMTTMPFSFGVIEAFNNINERCRFALLEPARDLIKTFDLGYGCGGIQRIENGNYIYLQFEGSNTKQSTMISLDPVTETQTTLKSGEFEDLLNVSPDGRYIVVVQDASGSIDRGEAVDPQLTIFEAESGDVVYQTPVEYLDNFTPPPFPGRKMVTVTHGTAKVMPYVLWIDSGRFLLRGANDQLFYVDGFDEPVALNGVAALLMPDGETLILETEVSETLHQLEAFNLGTSERIPITQPLEVNDSTPLRMILRSQPDGTLIWSFDGRSFHVRLKTE